MVGMHHFIPPTAHWQLALSHEGTAQGLADIAQCLATIVSTPLGSVPHRPDFGSRVYQYLDWPLPRAVPHVVREVFEAVERHEPRVRLVRVTPTADGARLVLRLRFVLVGDAAAIEHETQVRP